METPSFQVSNRVRTLLSGSLSGLVGTIVYISPPHYQNNILVEFDHPVPCGHSGGGRGKDGHCYWLHSHELASEPDTNKKAKAILSKRYDM